MAGRKKSKFRKYFSTIVSASKIPKIKCCFCSFMISENSTRMKKHIEVQCKKVPANIREMASAKDSESNLLDEDMDSEEIVETTSTTVCGRRYVILVFYVINGK